MTLDEIAAAEARAKAAQQSVPHYTEFCTYALTDIPALAATARTAIELLRQYDELHGSSASRLSADTKAFLATVAQKGGA